MATGVILTSFAERLQKDNELEGKVGVLNEGIIGNRLLSDSPNQAGSPFGATLGQSGLARFDRDVLEQAGVEYVIVGVGINDIAFPGSLTSGNEMLGAENMIAGVSSSHALTQRGLRLWVPPIRHLRIRS
jgi:lysophospholipase L1-like esterase